MKIKDIIDKDIVKIEVPYFDFNDYHKTGFIEVHHKVKEQIIHHLTILDLSQVLIN